MKRDCFEKGYSLVELLVTVALVSIVLAIIFPQFYSVIRQATTSRKMVKTESDVTMNIDQMFKDIQASGFGLPKTNDNMHKNVCVRDGNTAIVLSSNTLVIRSTASSDKEGAGAWDIVNEGGSLKMGTIPSGSSVMIMIMDITDPYLKKLGVFRYSGNNLTKIEQFNPTITLTGKIAYWIPSTSASSIVECYDTSYYLSGSSSTKPITCADGTSVLMRQKEPQDSSQATAPVMDCVLDMIVRFGCLDDNGNISWRDGNCNTNETKKLVRVGLIAQASQKNNDIVSKDSISVLGISKTLNSEQRYYRWTTIEKTIYLPNLE